MSRIGNKPIALPSGVTVQVNGAKVVVQGPKGKLERVIHPLVSVSLAGNEVRVARKGNDRRARGMHGLSRTLIANMIDGVVKPFERAVEISGVGYRAELKGSLLNIQVGFSHEVNHPIPPEVTCKVEKQTLVHLSSANKELVGRTAAEIRAYRPCEPYKGKGMKYVGERIQRKEGKKTA